MGYPGPQRRPVVRQEEIPEKLQNKQQKTTS
jgi:hypothetical protein